MQLLDSVVTKRAGKRGRSSFVVLSPMLLRFVHCLFYLFQLWPGRRKGRVVGVR